jgi:TonB family protein
VKPVPKNTAPPDAFGRSTKKPGQLAPPPAPPRASASAPATPASSATPQPAAPATDTIAAGTSGVTGLEGGDFPYTIYIENMRRLIGSHWFRPQGASATVTVHFVINRDGTIRDAVLETASGAGSLNSAFSSAFDRAALRAVIETSPLPPLPFAYSGTYLGVHLTFR